jgi:heme exporter protein B
VHALAFVALMLLGTLALSLIGTLFGVMTVRTRARDLVLAIVLFPLLSPVLVCGVAGTRNAFETQPFEDYSGFLGLMGLFVFVGLAMGIALFGALVDD